MRSVLLFLLLIIGLGALPHTAEATHVRAGEITARRISNTSLTYELKFTGYYNMDSEGINAARGTTYVDFWITGDPQYRRTPRVGDLAGMIDVGNQTTRNEYVLIYTFAAPGTYGISLGIDNRNNNILNIGPAPTNQRNFFIQTFLNINAGLGMNRTPVLLNSPIDLAAIGQRYIHNPGAFDADGDSLAFRLHRPLETLDNGKTSTNMDYRHPNLVTPLGPKEDGTFPAVFSIDAITGDLIWDAPSVAGFYNIAFVVEEWRNGNKIGEIVRDMQIIVEDAPNNRPELERPPDLCIEAGTSVQYTVRASDKDANVLTLTSSGGVYHDLLVALPLATFTAATQNPLGTATGLFSWQTSCEHIRDEMYEVTFKVEDGPGPGSPNPGFFKKLVDMVNLRIKVYAPAPKNLRSEPVADASGRAFRLTWDEYACKVPGAQIVIYRKEGCTDYTPVDCETGLPAALGYTVIARLGVDETSYVDNDNGEGLKRGIAYSYRMVVRIPRHGAGPTEPNRFVGGAESMPSEQVCETLPLLSPLLTNVTVDETDVTNGQITVRWTRPIGYDPNSGGGPFQYRLYRAEGLGGGNFGTTPVATFNTQHVSGTPDTLFVDKQLNTQDKAYHYKLEYYITSDGVLTLFDTTEPASSVRLGQGGASLTQIQLNWVAQVPWDNATGMTHRVYRQDPDNPDVYNQIAEVDVDGPAGFTYTDDGTDRYTADGDASLTLSPEGTYCYKVETVGSYNSSQVRPVLLYNFSQELCVSPSDTSKPCPPVLILDPLDCSELAQESYCGESGFTNELKWEYADNNDCDPALISEYRIYYTRYEGEAFQRIGSVYGPPSPPDSFYLHEGLTSFAGCYYVTAVNRFGNESEPSNTICRDNCAMISFPNVFTPNGDGKNDVFGPIGCSAFVESLEFKVFNRWGVKVWETSSQSDNVVNWDGTNMSGIELPAGQYYYECVAVIESVHRGGTPVRLKGWIQLLR